MNNKNNGTGTQLPGAGNSGTGTQLPGANGTGTQLPGGVSTGTQMPGTGTQMPGVNSGTQAPHGTGPMGTVDQIPELDEYIIKNVHYKTVDVIKKRSGEARVFVVENGGKKLALKVYISGHYPDTKILDIIQKKGQGGFLVNIYDHGLWAAPNGVQHYYEVMEYAPYGSLADVKIKTEQQFKDIAYRMAYCIKQCHDLNIIHRDVKPENFLFTDKEKTQFVLTDFGIARVISNKDERVVVDTARSTYFVSPEGTILRADNRTSVGLQTDYYSMGLTLLAMWVGTDAFYKNFSEDDLLQFKQENSVIEECGSMLRMTDWAKSLLSNLLTFSIKDRAGFDEVKRWAGGETLPDPNAKGDISKPGFRVVFNEDKGKIASSKEELAKMMLDDIEYAKLFLYRGMALNALQQSGMTALALRIDQITQKTYPGSDEQDAGVFAACLILDRNMPYVGIKGDRCTSLVDISKEVWAKKDLYVKELSKKGSRLWAYFTARGDETIKALPAKLQQVISRSGVHGIYALCKILKPDMPFYSKSGKEIRTGKEIATELWAKRDEYAKELANAEHSVWVYLRSLGDEGRKLADKYPALIRSNGLADLYSLCLCLDDSMPWYGKKGNACVDEVQVATEIWDYLGDYKKELADPNNLLWKYIATWGGSWVKIAKDYPALIKDNADVWAFELVYRLDPSKPYTVQYLDDKKWHGHNSFESILDGIYQHGITDFSLGMLTEADFQTWLTNKDGKRAALLQNVIKNLGNRAKSNPWYVLYSIAPELSLTLQRKSGSNDYVATASDLGKELNRQLNHFEASGSGAPADMMAMLANVNTFRSSRLRQYMDARKMSNHANGIEKIIDVDANIKAHPAAPYDNAIACWKVVEYLGHRPGYYFPASKKVASTLSEVQSVSLNERNAQVNKGLSAFLTIFFHEKAGASYTLNGLEGYYNFLCQYCPAHSGIVRSSSVKNDLNKAISDRNSAWNKLHNIRRFVMIFCLIPTVAILGWMLYMSFTDGASAIESAFMAVGTVISWVLCVVCGLLGFSGGIGGAIVGALAGYWIPYLIFKLLSEVAPLILAVIVIAAAVYLIIKLTRYTSDTYIEDKEDYDNLVAQGSLYSMCEAFGTTYRTFGNRSVNPQEIFEQSEELASSQRKSVYWAAGGLILLSVVTLFIGLSLMKEVKEVQETEYYAPRVAEKSEVAGYYNGDFHERSSRLTLREIEHEEFDFQGEVEIDYTEMMTQEVVGKYYGSDGRLILYVLKDGSVNRKIEYSGYVTVSGTSVTYSGGYVNQTKGTNHSFTYNK